MKLAFYLPPFPDESWRLALQAGVTHAVSRLPDPAGEPLWDVESLRQMRQRFAEAGFVLTVIEGRPLLEKTRLGLAGRDEEISWFCEMLHNMGRVGIPILCYNFMAQFRWVRTSFETPTRGGALTTSYQHALMTDAPLTEAGVVTDERLWDAFTYFLTRVVPVAEEAGVKLALHPDDPPVSPIRGIARIFRSVDAMRRATEVVPSPVNGITLCQGVFSAMGADIPVCVRDFGRTGKIHFVHFRDVRGRAESFVETFHDDGQTDMFAAMAAYREVGYDGPMRPDHAPSMEGEKAHRPGYGVTGRLFAIGYMKGLIEGVDALTCVDSRR